MDLDSLKNNPEQIKSLISLLESLLDKVEEAPVEDIETEVVVPKEKPQKKQKQRTNRFDGSKIKTSHTKTKANGINYFDDMPEKNKHKEDTAIDKKLSKYPPTERREKIQLIKVTCRSCGKSEQVSPVLIFDAERYKCNKCASSAG